MFGEVIAGKALVREIENLPTDSDKPKSDCVITDCGELSSDEDLPSKQPDKTGDLYEDYPEDQKKGEEEFEGPQIAKIATDLKGYGNAAFKSLDFGLALEKYDKALRYLNEYPEPAESDPPELGKELNQLRITLHSNSALMALKVNNYQSAESSASSALGISGITDAEKAKAYYRRALAKSGSKDDEAALADLKEAQKCAPGDAAVSSELAKIKKRATDREAKQKAAYKKFFD